MHSLSEFCFLCLFKAFNKLGFDHWQSYAETFIWLDISNNIYTSLISSYALLVWVIIKTSKVFKIHGINRNDIFQNSIKLILFLIIHNRLEILNFRLRIKFMIFLSISVFCNFSDRCFWFLRKNAFPLQLNYRVHKLLSKQGHLILRLLQFQLKLRLTWFRLIVSCHLICKALSYFLCKILVFKNFIDNHGCSLSLISLRSEFL